MTVHRRFGAVRESSPTVRRRFADGSPTVRRRFTTVYDGLRRFTTVSDINRRKPSETVGNRRKPSETVGEPSANRRRTVGHRRRTVGEPSANLRRRSILHRRSNIIFTTRATFFVTCTSFSGPNTREHVVCVHTHPMNAYECVCAPLPCGGYAFEMSHDVT